MRLFKRIIHSPGLLLLHLALLVIIAGGLTTWLTAEDDMLILRPSQPVEAHGFTAELTEFETVCYPGGTTPRDYISHLLIDGRNRTLSVNKPLTVNGWRLYQSSFTPDGCSIITLRSDRLGTRITFAGYALFCLGGLLCIGRRRVRALALLGAVAFGANAVPVIKPDVADSLARVQVAYQGRITTYSTVARDVLQKVYGKTSYKGLPAERVVLSLTAFPDEWNSQPIIKTEGKRHVSFNDCFDAAGNYLLANDAAADERVGIILLLRGGQLFSAIEGQPLSPARVETEIWYNRIPSTLIIFITLFAASLPAFVRPQWLLPGIAALLMQVAVIGVECWLTGHGPFSSTFETLQFLAAVVTLLALLMREIRPVGLLAAGCMALVAHLQAANPIVTPLMPVLHSPWLSLHVSLVMTSYAMLVIVAVTAGRGLFREPDRMRRRALGLLRPALYLLGLGIITGSVWANESWGRYWGWDPKETWALVTFLIYAVPLHRRKPSLWWFILPLLSVAMTYFGVNLLSSGSLHAYS